MILRPSTLIILSLVVAPTSVSAQTSTHETRTVELQKWMRAYTEWKAWAEKWWGKREPGWFGARERRAKPSPPEWLAEYCRDTAPPDETFAAGCRLLADWREHYAAALVKEQIRDERTVREAPTKTMWWSRVHFDALWVTTQIPATYGVIGIHATHKISGRLQIFLAPGAMLLNVPTPRGNREWKPATDLGVSYQLFDFRIPGNRRSATLHVNVAKAWVVGNQGSFIDSSVELAGLSVSFK